MEVLPASAVFASFVRQSLPRDSPVTIASPLHHSGPKQPRPGAGPIDFALALVRTAASRNTRLSLGTDFGAAALSFPLEHEPGSRFAFSNANAQLLGLILERATGMGYEQYVERKLWVPLGGDVGEDYMKRANGMPAV